MLSIQSLPALNASLNALSFLLLLAGYFFIKRRMIAHHKACMLTALSVSAAFLVSYLVYHYNVGSVRFQKEGLIRPVYFTILISHTVLAMTVVPLAAITLYRALKNQFKQHLRIARWTFPIWAYVSLTGVLIYVMLYRM